MSADYPNREDWLAIRNLQPPAPSYIHISAELYWYKDAAGGMHTGIKKGTTLNIGSRKIKRAIWAAKQAAKRERRALKKSPPTDGLSSHN